MDDMEKNNGRQHAVLSASSSHRWLECLPSARAEEAYPDEGSEFAKEGTLAHALAARKLKSMLGESTKAEDVEIEELSEYLNGEMQEYVDDYVNFVMERFADARDRTPDDKASPELYVEHRLDYSAWVREGFGTGDAVIVSHDTVEVIDLKYGKGVKVEARENPQMKIYALGAIEEFDVYYNFERVRMTVYQPRISNISTWECSEIELVLWARNVLEPSARLAWQGLGARKSGDWCRFCRAKADCVRLAADCHMEQYLSPNAEYLTAVEMSWLLSKIPVIKDWAKTVEEKSLSRALEGTVIPGYKVVRGRSVRRITDPRSVAISLKMAGFENSDIFKPMELRTLTEIEKRVGKKLFAERCGQWVEKPEGKPTLVPDSDSRMEFTAKSDFEGLEI